MTLIPDDETHEHFTAVVLEHTCLTGEEASKYALGMLDMVNHLREALRSLSGRVGGGPSPVPSFTAATAREFAAAVIARAQAT